MWASTFILACCYVCFAQHTTELTQGQVGSPWSSGNMDDYYFEQLHPEDALPVITTDKHTDTIATQGEDIILPCVVQNLGDFQLTWRRGQKILWTLKEMSAGPIVSAVVDDPRVGRAGTSLSLAGVSEHDGGNYTCEVETKPSRFITYTLDIRVPPRVYPVNNRSIVTVKTGHNITLSCNAYGNPKPNITWSRQGRDLGHLTTGSDLTIIAAQPEDNGIFRCLADNGAPQTDSASITLRVMYPPRVRAEFSKIYTGVNKHASLVCVVEAEPQPQIKWFRVGGEPVDILRLSKALQSAQRYLLKFRPVRKDDFGDYTCNATNFMGNASAVISLLGRPKPVRYYSEPQGEMETNYTLIWDVESFSPVITYNIAYKNESDLEEEWVNFTVPGTFSNSQYHSSSHTFTQLEPGATYHVQVSAVNEYGYSDINETFSFTTYNPGDSEVNEGQDLTDNNTHNGQEQETSGNLMEQEETVNMKKVPVEETAAAATVQDEESGATSISLTPAERRAQTIAFVTAISLSCFF